jgi:hypothetical protein
MGRSRLRVRIGVATDGMRDRVAASRDIWDEDAIDDVSVWLELPPDFRAPDDLAAYRQPTRVEMNIADDNSDEEKWLAYNDGEVF